TCARSAVSGQLCPARNSISRRTAYSCRTEFGESVRNALHLSSPVVEFDATLEGLNMKKLALALAAVAAFAGQAIAADMPARITKAPVAAPLPVASWTGFWVSGGFGYGLYDIDHSTVSTAIPPTIFDVGHDNGGRGWLGKVGVGGDYQVGRTVRHLGV